MDHWSGWREVAVVVALLAAMSAFMAPAQAHSGIESYVYLDLFEETIEGRVEFPLADLSEVLGLPLTGDDAAEVIAANLSLIQDYAAAHLSLGIGDDGWPLAFQSFEVLEIANGWYGVFPFHVDRTFDPVPRTFVVSYDAIIESKPERAALLLIATDLYSGTFRNESNHLLRFTSANTTQQVELDSPSTLRGLAAVIGLGFEHIRIGTDHIFFLLALLLPSVLVFGPVRRWVPAASFRSSLWRVLKIVTMFTVAHSITLTLGGLGLVELTPWLVESVIAISIALAALHNLRPVFLNREWLLAFGFGLFHGFGFAGLLSELGLDRSNRFVSLLGFNLGIEIGQAVIILLVFPGLFMLRRTLLYQPVMRLMSLGLTVVALLWGLDRLFGVDSGIDRLIDPILAGYRPLVLVVVFNLLAAVIQKREARRGRLLTVAGADVTSDREFERTR
jgi:hypothetical protein